MALQFPDIPGITIYPVNPASPATLNFDILPEQPPALPWAIDALWNLKRTENPHLFDGPLLLVNLDDLRNDFGVVRRSSYKFFVSIDDETLRFLGVQGVVIGRDASGTDHILLGRRSSEVRMYPGLWENAPSGGVEPPPLPATSINPAHFTKSLIAEGLEELGLDLAAADVAFLGLLEDASARSVDAVLRLTPSTPINPRALPCPTQDSGRWEYADTAWITLPELPAWVAANTHAISPPTLALLRWLAWA